MLLAIEQSTNSGSLALVRDQQVLAETQWTDIRFHNQRLFGALTELLAKAACRLDEVETYVVGVGPGSYTGLRTALAAAQAFALPDQRRVYGIGSAEALAWEIAAERACASVTIIGDARREQLWWRTFNRAAEVMVAAGSWQLIRRAELPGLRAAVVATSDWDRIGADLKNGLSRGIALVEDRRVPSAGVLGQLAERKLKRGAPSEPLTPIYLHPAVS